VPLLKTYRRALTYLWLEKHAFLSICIANIVLAVITIAEPILFGHVIDSISEKTGVVPTLAIWVGFGIFNIIAYVLVARGADRLTHRRRLGVMTQSFEKIITMPLSWHQQRGTSNALHTLIRATDSLTAIWLEFMRQHLSTFVALAVLIPTAFTMDWRLSMVLVVLGVIYVMIARLVMRKTKHGQASIEHHHHRLFEHISDSISNVAVVQGYNRIREESRMMRSQAANLLKVQYPVLNWWALASGLNRMASTISMVVVLLLGAFLVTRGKLRVGDVVAFVGFAQLMIGRLDQISAFINLAVTTLINLLQRVYDPAAGSITIDGIDTRTVSRESLRNALATVFQDAGLFNRSIGANIRIGRSNASKTAIRNAARAAAAHDFIMDKSERYDTMVGERGSQLSGGERQRIAIARAILKNAPILVLDEATSALDVETEARVKDALDMVSRNRTTLVIAHRLSTVRNADLVLFIDHGRLIEKGSFQELAAKGGRFSKLLRAGGLTIDQALPGRRGSNVTPFPGQGVA